MLSTSVSLDSSPLRLLLEPPVQFMGSYSWGFLEPVPSPTYYSSLHSSKDTNPRNPPTLSGPQNTC